MINGLRKLRTIWRRKMWKIWLAVVGCTICMLVSAAQLHETLQTCRAVLWALAFVAVRQHQSNAVNATPFNFTTGDKLVNHHLCTIGKIAKLRFPNHQSIWVIGGIAVFKSQNSFFRQNRVNNHKRCLRWRHVLQGV